MTSVPRSVAARQVTYCLLGLTTMVLLSGCTPPPPEPGGPSVTTPAQSSPAVTTPTPAEEAPSAVTEEVAGAIADQTPTSEEAAEEAVDTSEAPEAPMPETPVEEGPAAEPAPQPEAEPVKEEAPAAEAQPEEEKEEASAPQAEPEMEEPKEEAPAAEEQPEETEEAPAAPAVNEDAADEQPGEESTEVAMAEEPSEEAEEAAAEEEKSAEEETSREEAVEKALDPTSAVTVEWMPEPIPNPDAEAKTEEEMKPYVEEIPDTDVSFKMVPIPGGEFVMGSPDDEEERGEGEGPQVKVKVEPFWMGAHEVSWDEYELWGLGLDKQRREVLGVESTERHMLVDAISIPTKPYTDMTFGMGKETYPAICMTQLAAKMYCKWLSAKTGRYYRLPTEAEWEYACRAGSDAAYSFGDDPEKLGDYAWYYENSDEQYQPVGQKKPNKWGLYDMHGNVAEWVIDEYNLEYYKELKDQGKEPVERPLKIAEKIYPRCIRGGSWDDDPPALRSAARRGSNVDWKMQDPQIPQSIWYHTDADFVGFRVIRPLKTPTAEEAKLYEVDAAQELDMAEYKEAQAGKM